MVESGLSENTDVSHYRLALHLTVAFIILSIVFWFILENLEGKSFEKITNRPINDENINKNRQKYYTKD